LTSRTIQQTKGSNVNTPQEPRVIRISLVSIMLAILSLIGLAEPTLAASDTAGGGPLACPTKVAPEPSATASAPADSTTRIAAAIQVAPGINAPRLEGIGTVVSHTVETWTDGQLTGGHEATSTFYPLSSVATSSSGGKLASIQAGTCTKTGSWTQQSHDWVCGGGCIDQYMTRTVDTFSNDADLVNTYYDRIEVRFWFVRDSTNIYLTGSAYTHFQDVMVDCNGANSNHDVDSYTSVSWYTTYRSYDYYYDETWLPNVGGPDFMHLLVTTDTPESYGRDLYSQIINN
jgi:hypothetical protein